MPKIDNPTPAPVDWRTVRRLLGLNQSQFWGALGITQSAGSRYESGRELPKPKAELARLAYVEGIDPSQIDHESMEVLRYLHTVEPERLDALRKTAKAWRKQLEPQRLAA